MVAVVIHHECSLVGSYSPDLLWTHHAHVCHDHGRYFGQWNLSRVDKSLPNGSIIFCPTSWDADVMTGAEADILDQRYIACVEDVTRKKWAPLSVERPAQTLYERELKLYSI